MWLSDKEVAPAVQQHPEARTQGDGPVTNETLPQPSTRRHRVDYEFLGLLNEDFGIDFYSLNKAFMGVPPSPKKQAIHLCEWALRSAKGDVEEAGKALRAWARKSGAGAYNPHLLEAPEATYEANEHERRVTGGGFLAEEGEYV
jgi:hypothetical protein